MLQSNIFVIGGTEKERENAQHMQLLFDALYPLMSKHIDLENRIYELMEKIPGYSFPRSVYEITRTINSNIPRKMMALYNTTLDHFTVWKTGKIIGTSEKKEIQTIKLERQTELKDLYVLADDAKKIKRQMYDVVLAFLNCDKEFGVYLMSRLDNEDYCVMTIDRLVSDVNNNYGIWCNGRNA